MTTAERRELWVVDLGRMDYEAALELQRNAARNRISGVVPQDVLFLVEHPPVVTLGRRSKQQNLMASEQMLAERGVRLFEVERGGDVTFHGPGQLVGYPIIDLKRHRQDLHWFLRQVEEAIIRTLAAFGIDAERKVGFTGVWTRGRKIASIGVHARDWVTWHGFALNVTTDLSYFDLIVACGIDGVEITSVEKELRVRGAVAAEGLSVDSVGHALHAAFAEVFGLNPIRMSAASFEPKMAPMDTDESGKETRTDPDSH